jgi:hypothetical protein
VPIFALKGGDYFDFGTGQVNGGWQAGKVWVLGACLNCFLDFGALDQNLLDSQGALTMLNTKSGGGVALWIKVNHQYL